MIAGDQASPADVERIRQSLGLDRPFLVRFGEWVWQILHGDLGTSIFTNLPVAALIGQRIEGCNQPLAVRAEIVEWENRLKIEYLIRDAKTGEKVNTATSIQVAVDMATREMQYVCPRVLWERLGVSPC